MRDQLRALIIDDEDSARDALLKLLKAHPYVKVIGEANSVTAAALLYKNLRPDLIFLDVNMPKRNGFSLLPKLHPVPAIIFTTAYDEYAVRAFQINAVDYLLKPIKAERLYDALQRVIHGLGTEQTKSYLVDNRFLFRSDSQMRMIFLTDISQIQAEENYTRVHVCDGSSAILRKGIEEWETTLPKPPFLRLHRSLIVNLEAIEKVSMETATETLIELKGLSAPLVLNRRISSRLRQALRQSHLS